MRLTSNAWTTDRGADLRTMWRCLAAAVAVAMNVAGCSHLASSSSPESTPGGWGNRQSAAGDTARALLVSTFGNPGNSDVATEGLIAGSAVPRNCFYANKAATGTLTSVPVGIEQPSADGQPCSKPGTSGDAALLAQLGCATLDGRCAVPHASYPRQTRIDSVSLPVVASMPDPCAGVPQNTYCTAGTQAARTAGADSSYAS